MFRLRAIKIKNAVILLGTVFGIAALSISVQAKICEDHEYVLTYGKIGNGMSIYNSDGEYCAGVDVSTDWAKEPLVLSEDTILLERKNYSTVPFSLTEMRELGEYPNGTTKVVSCSGHYAVMDKEKNYFEVYDGSGQIIYRAEFTEEFFKGNSDIGMVPLKDGFAAAISGDQQSIGVWFDQNGTMVKELSEAVSSKIAGHTESIGNYIMIYNSEGNALWDMDGNELISADNITIYDGINYGLFESDLGFESNGIYAVVSQSDGQEILLNQDLESCAFQPDTDSNRKCYGNYIMGGIYEELGNRECVGFVMDGSNVMRPYARENGKIYILTDDTSWTLLEIDLPEGEYPYLYNQDYLVAGEIPDNSNIFKVYIGFEGNIYSDSSYSLEEAGMIFVYHYSDGELFYSANASDTTAQLGDHLLYIINNNSQTEKLRAEVYDGNGQLLREVGEQVHWKYNLWYTERGIYRGLLNESGEWELKIIYVD